MSTDSTPRLLRLSQSRRFLEHEDGTPFLWVGDTAWYLFHKCDAEQADQYLADRAERGFTVIQTILTGPSYEVGINRANAYGETLFAPDPLDPGSPNERFFEHVERVLDLAAARGLYVGLVPVWGGYLTPVGQSYLPRVFDSQTLVSFTRWVVERLKHKPNLLWILGGDRSPDAEPWALEAWRNQGRAAREADSEHLITFHTPGNTSSSHWFHEEPWLDFNMIQTYRHVDRTKPIVLEDYRRAPTKPVVLGEPAYEGEHGYSRLTYRAQAYWALLSGACGYSHGCWGVWQFTDWQKHLASPGAQDVARFASVMRELPWHELRPSHESVSQDLPWGGNRIPYETACATSGETTLVYTANGYPLRIDAAVLPASVQRATWYSPADGARVEADTSHLAERALHPPEGWDDALLILRAQPGER